MKANRYTKDLRKALRMRAWNSRPSRFTADTWFSFAIKNIERKRALATQNMVLYAISQARARGVLDGTLELALRSLTGWQLSAIVGRLCETCETHSQVIERVRMERTAIISMAS